MKKILIIITGLIITAPTYATTMCAANDTVAVVLDISSTNFKSSADNTTGIWHLWTPAWTVHGISACLNGNQGRGTGGTVAHLHDTDNNGNNHLVTGSEVYGRYCWCRLTHPVLSLWTFNSDRSSGSNCASGCASSCVYYIGHVLNFRLGLFNSVKYK